LQNHLFAKFCTAFAPFNALAASALCAQLIPGPFVVYIEIKAPMSQPAPAPAILRFDVYALDLRAGEFYKNGRKIKLQEQPFQILAMLLEHPGEVVTREEMRQRLWPGDTFVDFEHSLNTAIKKIRRALDDEAGKPRFVETLRRRGYRFAGSMAEDSFSSASLFLQATPGSAPTSEQAPVESADEMVGKVLTLQDELGTELLTLSIDEAAQQEKQKLEAASDDLGLALLFADQKLLMVRAGTRVKILDRLPAGTCYEVRILEGEHTAKTALAPAHRLGEAPTKQIEK
jgi:DNA-binding winged helix-turn-helix (wHTH) protein